MIGKYLASIELIVLLVLVGKLIIWKQLLLVELVAVAVRIAEQHIAMLAFIAFVRITAFATFVASVAFTCINFEVAFASFVG